MNRRGTGSQGERDTRDFLRARGIEVVEMNYRRPTGEIDIIARQGTTLLFIEVKRRASTRYGRPAEAVTPTKQRRILRTALLYLQEKGLMDTSARFDIIEVLPGEIRHIENAFDAGAIY